MRSALTLACDGLGCLERGHWAGFRYHGSSARLRHDAKRQWRNAAPEIANDAGVHEICVMTRVVVCTGQAPPNDHPSTELRRVRAGYH